MMKEAYYYTKQPDQRVRCDLCPRHCILSHGQCGFCQQYRSLDSTLYSFHYGQVASMAIDPIEKKPLYHYHPGQKILSIGSYGCNLTCSFCQNHDLSFGSGETYPVTPEEINKALDRYHVNHMAFTYNEPLIQYEFVKDTFQYLKQHTSCYTVLVTNGFIEESPLLALLPYTDAMNIDWKGPASFYQTYCHGQLQPVQRAISQAFRRCHIEITYLVIPGCNDKDSDFIECRDFLTSLSPLIPVHLNRYFPAYKMKNPPTSASVLNKARELMMETMPYVYIGNIPIPGMSDTFCRHCHARLIKRENYDIYYINMVEDRCQMCSEKTDIVLGEKAC